MMSKSMHGKRDRLIANEFSGKRGRSLDSICPVGDPLRISDTIRPFLCGNDPGKPTCPPLYQCLVQQGKRYI